MIEYLLIIIIFLFSVIIHEISHGWTADLLGDPTAREAGRLTLNPLKHLDPFGSVLLPLMLILFQSRIIFGWAKPVPVNNFNLRGKFAEAKVAAAGPLANISLAVFFGLLLRFIPWMRIPSGENIIIAFGFIVWVNLLLAVFNLIPIPPLDGSHILFALLPDKYNQLKVNLSRYGLFILIFFIFFLFQFIVPVVNFLFGLIVGVPFI